MKTMTERLANLFRWMLYGHVVVGNMAVYCYKNDNANFKKTYVSNGTQIYHYTAWANDDFEKALEEDNIKVFLCRDWFYLYIVGLNEEEVDILNSCRSSTYYNYIDLNKIASELLVNTKLYDENK